MLPISRIQFWNLRLLQREVFVSIVSGSAAHQRKQRLPLKTVEFWVGPFLIAGRERAKIFERAANAATVFGLIVPQVHVNVLCQTRQPHQAIEVHVAVAPGFGARQFQRLTPVRFYLEGNPLLFGGLDDLFCQIVSGQEARNKVVALAAYSSLPLKKKATDSVRTAASIWSSV